MRVTWTSVLSNMSEIVSAPSLNAVSRYKKSASVRQADVPTNFNPVWPRNNPAHHWHSLLSSFSRQHLLSRAASTLPWRNLEREVSLWKRRIKCFPFTLRWRNLKTEVSLWKRIKCFPFTLRWWNLKTEVSLWKRIKCFPSTLHWRNLKVKVSLWKRIKCFPFTLGWGTLKTQQSPAIWALSWRKPRSGKFSKSYGFPPTRKRKAGVFRFLLFEERFQHSGLTEEIALRFQVYLVRWESVRPFSWWQLFSDLKVNEKLFSAWEINLNSMR